MLRSVNFTHCIGYALLAVAVLLWCCLITEGMAQACYGPLMTHVYTAMLFFTVAFLAKVVSAN